MVREYYEYAMVFIKLSWVSKYCIGFDLGVLGDDDRYMEDEEIENIVFSEMVNKGLFLRFKESLEHYRDKEIAEMKINRTNMKYW